MIIESLCKYYGVEKLKNVTVFGDTITEWGDDRFQKPSAEEIELAVQKYKKKDYKIIKIKSMAEQKILLIAPEYKQLNALRDGDVDGFFPRIDAIRNYSNLLESKIINGEDIDINEGWPE